VKIHAGPAVLSVFVTDSEAYFFDRSGRFFAAWQEGWFISLGLSGRSVARQWQEGHREIRPLKPAEIRDLEAKAKSALQAAYTSADENDKLWFGRALTFDRAQDTARFQKVYQPVGILPPDQYLACVIQVTEGCGWNRCRFCSFYRRQTFRQKDRRDLNGHIEQIAALFGEGLSLRRSIFLGEANALGAPLEVIASAMEIAQEKLVPRMEAFRGFYSFSEGSPGSCHLPAEFRTLARLGLKRVYYGLETGHDELREKLGKPGTPESIEESIRNAKAAGLRISVILLAGAGGKPWASRHMKQSIRLIQRLPLDASDIVYVSPLHGKEGTSETPLSAEETRRQVADLRQALAPRVRVAPYNIREFVY
jgi:radical SAM superfamily enzyme YgiQ (UPF0313 family)